MNSKIAIIGAGNLGKAIAKGLVKSGKYLPENITLTRRTLSELSPYKNNGFSITDNNLSAVKVNEMIIVSVGPQDAEQVLDSFNYIVYYTFFILFTYFTPIVKFGKGLIRSLRIIIGVGLFTLPIKSVML